MIHSTQVCIPLKPLFSRHKGAGVQFTDEPTGNLDSKSSRTVIEAFENAKSQMDATIFMVTHDSFSASFCDRVILLKDGQIFRQLIKHGKRSEFHDQLLETIKEMSGDES